MYLKLYTYNNSNPTYVNEITKRQNINNYCRNCQNYFIIHEFGEDENEKWIDEMKNELFKYNSSSNIFIVGWKDIQMVFKYLKVYYYLDPNSGEPYDYYSYTLAFRRLSKLLSNLYDKNFFNINNIIVINIHCIGHGLGTRVCRYLTSKMYAGSYNQLSVTLTRLTSLNPHHGRYYQHTGFYAVFSDSIFSNDSYIYNDLGHSNFFIFDAYNQSESNTSLETKYSNYDKKCLACYYFTKSISQCIKRAYECYSYEFFEKGFCSKCTENPFGFHSFKIYDERNMIKKFYINFESFDDCKVASIEAKAIDKYYCENKASSNYIVSIETFYFLIASSLFLLKSVFYCVL